MTETLTHKLIADHRMDGALDAGEAVALRFDQTLTQDATGTLVMLALEAMGLDRATPEICVQYVDHNLIQEDNRNPDDHLFLLSACRRFGLWYSRPGNGVSHPLHMQHFGRPGTSLIGADSHTPAAGALGMFAIGAGGADVATAIAGDPVWLRMPEVMGVELTGTLPSGVSAKDVILEMLRRHGTDGAAGCVLEYFGPGLDALSTMDRHVIANMGTELGATTSVFPSDGEVRRYLEQQGRGEDWRDLGADPQAEFDRHEHIELSDLEPLIAKPSSPGKVVPVREVAGETIYQAYIGSSANPGYRDFAVAAEMLRGRRAAPHVSLDINPTSRQLLHELIANDTLAPLVAAGARLHQAGCNGCIGMGQAPATGRNSLRTTPRNFPGRSGTPEDSVFLCSPETAAASAITGAITDPRDLDFDIPQVRPHKRIAPDPGLLLAPPPEEAREVQLEKGPNIAELPELDPLPDRLEVTVLLTLDDDISTDEIMPAGAEVLPYRSNIPRIADFVFRDIDADYPERARDLSDEDGHAIVAGRNYGQGSSREHAALAPRQLGLRVVIAETIARIHWQNLINFGVLPLTFAVPEDRDRLVQGDVLVLEGLGDKLGAEDAVIARRTGDDAEFELQAGLTARQAQLLHDGGLINHLRSRMS